MSTRSDDFIDARRPDLLGLAILSNLAGALAGLKTTTDLSVACGLPMEITLRLSTVTTNLERQVADLDYLLAYYRGRGIEEDFRAIYGPLDPSQADQFIPENIH